MAYQLGPNVGRNLLIGFGLTVVVMCVAQVAENRASSPTKILTPAEHIAEAVAQRANDPHYNEDDDVQIDKEVQTFGCVERTLHMEVPQIRFDGKNWAIENLPHDRYNIYGYVIIPKTGRRGYIARLHWPDQTVHPGRLVERITCESVTWF